MNDEALSRYAALTGRLVREGKVQAHTTFTRLSPTEHRERLAACGAGEGPQAASTPSVDAMNDGADAAARGLSPALPAACPHGPVVLPVA